MALDPNRLIEGMADIQRLVHLAARSDSVDAGQWRALLLKQRRRAYEDELGIQAARVGCPGRAGRLGNNEILSALSDASGRDAESIVNTFNYFLAAEIVRIRQDAPRANRYVYAKRIRDWEAGYWKFKQAQIDTMTDGSARAMAQQDFYRFNRQTGAARLQPTAAVCPICQGWVRRGLVPLRVATNNPPPYHVNCFPPDAQVRMADGTEKRIDEIEEGESVATREGSCRVVRVFSRRTREALYRVFVGGRVLRLTGDHPVLTARGWLPALELVIDDRLIMALHGNAITCMMEKIDGIEIEDYEGAVFNLETESHEYVVSDVIVHNCPHLWDVRPEQVAKDDCPTLWMGS